MISSRLATARILRLGRLGLLAAAEELHAIGHDLDCRAPFAVRVVPGPAPQLAVDRDLSATREVLAAQLGLLVPRRDPEEVRGRRVRPRPVDGEQEARDLPVRVDLLQLDVRREIPDQRDAVHCLLLPRDVASTLARRNARNCTETAPSRSGVTCA